VTMFALLIKCTLWWHSFDKSFDYFNTGNRSIDYSLV